MFVEKKVYRMVSGGGNWDILASEWLELQEPDQVRVRSAFPATGCFRSVGPFLNLTNLEYLRGRALLWRWESGAGQGMPGWLQS